MHENIWIDPAKIRMTNILKKDGKYNRTINGHWYVINGKNGTYVEYVMLCHWYAEANNKYMKNYDKNKEL